MLERALGVPPRPDVLPAPLDMLVATILSQNTNDRNSHRAFRQLRETFPTWDRVAEAPLPRLRRALRTGGMAAQKSVRVRTILRALHEKYGDYTLRSLSRKTDQEVIDELTAFTGVGVKTAACVLLFSLGRDVFPVDTHVHRLCTRLGLAPLSRTPAETFELMRGVVPRGKAHSLHTNLIRLGRLICRPTAPACGVCPLFDECRFDGKRSAAGRRTVRHPNADFMLLDSIPA
jgi:endonuclease-3